jgi:hypothetical protein
MILGQKVLTTIEVVKFVVAKCFYTAGKLISPEQAKYHESLTDQEEQLSELDLMSRMVELKDEAVAEDDWDEDQLMELNGLATMLNQLHGWSQKNIDTYVRQLVAAGPEGYSYGKPEDLEGGDFDDFNFSTKS